MIKTIPIYLAIAISSISNMVLSIALRDIQKDFGVSLSTAGWVIVIYSVSLALFGPLHGKLSDRYTTAKVFNYSLVLAVISTLASAFSPNMSFLLITRLLQGVVASAFFMVGQMLLVQILPKSKTGFALGLVPTVVSASVIIGPLFGGLILQYLPWRVILVILSVLYLICWIFSRELLRIKLDFEGKTDLKIDFIGLFVLGVSISILLFSLTIRRLDIFGISILALFFSVIYQLRSREPYLPLKKLRNLNLAYGSAIGFFGVFTILATIVFFPIFLRDVHSLPTLSIGVCFLALSLGMALGGPIGGKVSDRIGPVFSIKSGIVISLSASILFYFLPKGLTLSLVLIFMIILGATTIIACIPKLIVVSVSGAEFSVSFGLYNVIMFLGHGFGANFASFSMDKNNALQFMGHDINGNTLIFLIFIVLLSLALLFSLGLNLRERPSQ